MAADSSPVILPDCADKYAEYVQGVYVVVAETTDNRMRRRVYLNLPSAQKAVARAEARGHCARLLLARLNVVGEAI